MSGWSHLNTLVSVFPILARTSQVLRKTTFLYILKSFSIWLACRSEPLSNVILVVHICAYKETSGLTVFITDPFPREEHYCA